jgi:multidrug/hemolysin transport system permease protein
MEAPMQVAFEGVPASYMNEFKEYMGVTFRFGGHEVTPAASILILIATAVVFYGLSLFSLRKRSCERM